MTKTKDRILGKQNAVRSSYFSNNNRFNRASLSESDLELDYYRMMQFMLPEGSDFAVQPESIMLTINGKNVRYTSDGRIREPLFFPIYHEVKYESDLGNPDVQEKLEAAAEYYFSKGSGFEVYTENDIRIGHQAENISMLMSSLHHDKPIRDYELLSKGLTNRYYSIDEMYTLAEQKGLAPSVVNRCVAHKLFICDLTISWPNIGLKAT